MSKKVIHYLYILDASTSMFGSKADKVREGLEADLNGIIADKTIKPRVTIIKFSSSHSITALAVERKRKEIKETKKEILAAYRTSGMTALYDAIGEGIKLLNGRKNVFVNIMTDGEENDSKKFTASTIKELISEKRNQGWAITFFGTNEQSINDAVNNLGISRGNTMSYQDNAQGVTMASMTRSVASNKYKQAIINNDTSNTDNLIQD